MSKNIHATQDWVKDNLNVSSITDLTEDVEIIGKNLFDKSKIIENTMVDGSNGQTSTSNSYFATDYIAINAKTKYVANNIRTWATYDASYEFVSGAGGAQVNIESKNTIINTNPKNGKTPCYLRFTSTPRYKDTIQLELGEVATSYEPYKNEIKTVFSDFALLNDKQVAQAKATLQHNILNGKKWCVVGDSFSDEFLPVGDYPANWYFTDGKFVGAPKLYWYLIANKNDMTLQNMAKSGRTLAVAEDRTSNAFSLEGYYDTIDADVDYITIMLGGNDEHSSSGQVDIGDIEDTTNNTFYGAWNKVLPYLLENYPKAKIGIIVENAFNNNSFREATIKMAKRYGIPYIDLNGDERTRAMFRTVNDIPETIKTILKEQQAIRPYAEGDLEANLHPNALAHEIESTIIENFLRSL